MDLRRIHDEQAQGVIEFALIATVLMLLFLGTFDYARFLYYNSAIVSAARTGAETASNHCPFAAAGCGTTSTVTSDTYVLWSASCEASSSVALNPSYSSCDQGTTSTWTPTCSGSGCTNCSGDICVSPSTRSAGTQVTVTVGYKFHPVAFLLDWLFTERSCFSGDSVSSNHHTLCASAVGRVS